MNKENIDINKAEEIIKKQNFQLKKAIPQGYIFNFVYGLSWIIGYGSLAITKLSYTGWLIFSISLVLASIVCMFYLFKTLRGVKTINSKYNAWWGISWCIGFVIHSSITNFTEKILSNCNLENNVLLQISWTVGNSVALLIVCLCFLGGAALFKEKHLGVLGIIVGLLAILSSSLTPVNGSIVCAIGGVVMILFSFFDFHKSKKSYKEEYCG